MKEPWQKQYDEKKTPWNYDHFDEDIQKFLKHNDVWICKRIDIAKHWIKNYSNI